MSRLNIALTGFAIALVIILSLAAYDYARPHPMPAKFVKVWQSLPGSESGCFDYDYWPEGGMRNFYCHLRTLINYEEIQKQFGGPLFVSGPHTTAALDLDSETEFGHYNPKFVRWLAENFIPHDKDLKATLRPIFDAYVQPLALLYLKAILRLESDPALFDKEVEHYEHYLQTSEKLSTTRPLDRYYALLPDETYPEPAIGFWVRRRMDGTDQVFKEALIQLIEEFAPDRLKELRGINWQEYVQANSGESESFVDYGVEEEQRNISLEYDNSTLQGVVKNLWTAIADTSTRCPNQFDYFPQGGLRVYYCHALDIISLADFESMLGMEIFLSGPHKGGELELENHQMFGHYNPKFVRWMIDHIVPAADDEAFKSRTELIFRDHIGFAARTFYTALKLIQAFPTDYRNSLAAYKTYIQSGGDHLPQFDLLAHRLFAIEDHFLPNKIDYVFSTSAFSFWMRRDMDGTQALFAEAVEKLVATYDPEFVAQVEALDLTELKDPGKTSAQ